jgi:hypothetical protein
MAIEPVNERINQLTANISQTQLFPDDKPVPNAQPVEEELPQIAGPLSVLKGVLKGGEAVRGGNIVKQAEKLAEESGKALPIPAAATPAKEPVKVIAPLKPKKQIVAPTPEKLEADAALATGTGKPPETPFNLDLQDDKSVAQYTEAMLKNSNISYEKMSLAEVENKVRELGFGDEYIANIRNIADRYGDLPVEVRRASLAFPLHVKKMGEISNRILKEGATPELTKEFLDQFAVTVHVGQAAKDIQVKPAQALRVLNQSRSTIAETDLGSLKTMLDNPNLPSEVQEAAKALSTMVDDASRSKLVEKLSKVGFVKDLWLSTWINGLLSWTATPIINVASNSTFALLQPITRTVAGGIGSVRTMLPNSNPDRVFIGEGFAGLAGYVQGSKDALMLGWQSLKTGTTLEQRMGEPLLGAGSKLETRGSAAGLDAAEYGFTGKTAAALTLWSKFVATSGRVIQSTDEAFKGLAYRFEVNAQAYRQAEITRNQLIDDGVDEITAGQKAEQKVIELMNNPSEEIDLAAEDFSKMLTFTRDLEGFAERVQSVSNANLLTKTTMPFVRTPTWLISEGLQHSWYAPLSSQWRKDMAAGGASRDLALAKFGLGSVAMVGLTSLAVDGRITGGGPANSDLRKVYQRDGWRSYSLVLNESEYDQEFVDYLSTIPRMDPSIGKNGKLYISIRGFEPIAAPIAMAADYVEYARYEDDDDNVAQIGLGGLFGIYQYVGQSPFMQTLGGLVGTLGNSVPNPKQVLKDVVNQLAMNASEYAIGGSPAGAWSSFQAGIERYVDGTKKDFTAPSDMPTGVKGFYEGYLRWRSRVPVLSADLPDRLNRWAEPDQEMDPARPWLGFTGIRTSESSMKEVDRMLISIGLPLAMPARNISQSDPSSRISATVKLEPEEYNELLKIYAKEIEIGGMTVQEALVARAKDPEFELLDKIYQQQAIKNIDDEYMSMARDMLIKESKYSDALQSRLEKERDRKQIRGAYKQ